MTPELLNGLIGAGGALSGALLGGLLTFGGVVYQQNRQTRQAVETRRRDITEQAIEAIFGQLQRLRHLTENSPSQFVDWDSAIDECLTEIYLKAQRISDKEIRKSLEAAVASAFGSSPAFRAPRDRASSDRHLIICMVNEVQELLSTFLRGDPLPTGQPHLRRARRITEKSARLWAAALRPVDE
ncbi:hypothetical protein Q7689_00700 [Nocardiopsis tropica]|uniref:hypothetical protein n=1 Tax=Nocardiopsis tropica TaxID=109330 RepID=UPI002E8BC3FD|nr:hypothetical protein [Nocardiopsis tropica]